MTQIFDDILARYKSNLIIELDGLEQEAQDIMIKTEVAAGKLQLLFELAETFKSKQPVEIDIDDEDTDFIKLMTITNKTIN